MTTGERAYMVAYCSLQRNGDGRRRESSTHLLLELRHHCALAQSLLCCDGLLQCVAPLARGRLPVVGVTVAAAAAADASANSSRRRHSACWAQPRHQPRHKMWIVAALGALFFGNGASSLLLPMARLASPPFRPTVAAGSAPPVPAAGRLRAGRSVLAPNMSWPDTC
jgi:hypothetical protein